MLRMAAFTNPQAVISQEDVRLSEPVRPHVPWRFLHLRDWGRVSTFNNVSGNRANCLQFIRFSGEPQTECGGRDVFGSRRGVLTNSAIRSGAAGKTAAARLWAG
jgi:hypothetical protein